MTAHTLHGLLGRNQHGKPTLGTVNNMTTYKIRGNRTADDYVKALHAKVRELRSEAAKIQARAEAIEQIAWDLSIDLEEQPREGVHN